jgi:hypothetical protein
VAMKNRGSSMTERPTTSRRAAALTAIAAGIFGLVIGCAAGTTPTPPVVDRSVPRPTLVAPTPTVKIQPMKGVDTTVPNGDHLVGDKIGAGTYVSPGAQNTGIKLCTVSTRTNEGTYLELNTGGVGEQVVVLVSDQADVLEVHGCEPFKKR